MTKQQQKDRDEAPPAADRDYIRQDDREPEERQHTVGFWVATDKFMSGWGMAKGRSLVACPVFGADDADQVERRFRLRREFLRVRFVPGDTFYPKLYAGDHLHIYDGRSFRYPL